MKYCFVVPFLSVFTIPAMEHGVGSPDLKGILIVASLVLLLLVCVVLWMIIRLREVHHNHLKSTTKGFSLKLLDLSPNESEMLLKARKGQRTQTQPAKKAVLFIAGLLMSTSLSAQVGQKSPELFTEPGIIITIVLLLIPLFVGVVYLIAKVSRLISQYGRKQKETEAQRLADYLLSADDAEIDYSLSRKMATLKNPLTHHELSGIATAEDPAGILQPVQGDSSIRFVAAKKKAAKRPEIDSNLSKLVIWFLGTAAFWLIFGTTVGEYLGIKFVAPDVDHQSWLSFGRLRPVHTNAVFWGWSSLAMLGLGYYVVPAVSNTRIASFKKGWITLWLVNVSVVAGTICLMAGINNGGGEYREYVWPVMALFAMGLVLTLLNFIQTIARRKTTEIYISNWYIVSAIIFTIVIAVLAYWPTWQDGLGETIIQGYYMHQGVGMWFMLFSLGIVYYFLPQQLNKPIYSYSLGIIAFWTQILFYTVIGTHHFVFSSIPWSLQTVAIVGSMGMVIPVVAGTTNFLMTFKGDFQRVASSYTLPFYLVGIVFYFTGSLQGTAEAFRYTNLLWHFTDFTVAHSHITMYGIIAFLLWGSIYAIIPRMTGREPGQLMVGVHFWLAFLGLLLYSVPLMIGGTFKGMMWMDGRPFMESVTMMAPYWLWRAIGGTMMWLSHLIFARNFYVMVSRPKPGIRQMALRRIEKMEMEKTFEPSIN
jgi:cytochrome c oxidase cbb3-type subunit I